MGYDILLPLNTVDGIFLLSAMTMVVIDAGDATERQGGWRSRADRRGAQEASAANESESR